ncbi:MAG: hypothetical protein JWN37_865 [Candidatus Nomurabacteria bacterium]|nr:hypothetical protein [Candidatus Nomurabacteria bacterium]
MKEGFNSRRLWLKLGYFLAGLTIIALVIIGVTWIWFVQFVDTYQQGYVFNTRTGKITTLERTGYFVRTPIVEQYHTVDLRPMQVCINANQRVLNCKLVQFNAKGLDLFLSWHGRRDYEGPGTGGSRKGGKERTTDFSEILKSYAYEGTGKIYPFLSVVRELKNEDAK